MDQGRGQSRLLDLIFRHTLDSVALLDKDYNFVRVSDSYALADQRDPADFPGRNHFDLYPSSFKDELEEYRREKKVYFREERPFVYPDHPEWGTTYWNVSVVPILDSAGEIEYLLLTLRDVTPSVRARTQLLESEAKFSKAFHGNPTPMAIRRAKDDILIDVNHSFELTFGYDRSEVLGKTVGGMGFYADPAERPVVLRNSSAGAVKNIELNLRTKSGEIKCVLISVEPLSLQGEACLLGCFVDITERKRMETALREVSTVAQVRSHQLQTLAGALLDAEQSERRRIGSFLHDHVQQLLVAAAMHLKRISGTAAGIEEQRAAVSTACAILGEAIESTRSLAYDLHPPILSQPGLGKALNWLAAEMRKRHGLAIEVRVDREPPKLPESVRDFVYEAARELLFNVVKHARAGSATITASSAEDLLRVTITDDGVGFDATMAERNAAGLGLSRIQERIGLLGGRLEIDGPGKAGSRIVLSIPCS